ncbi:DUF6502 family protein [bacterium]|nr:DUF6502 family protein [bacterium]
MSDTFKYTLAKAVVTILRPMIRLLMRFEFTHSELSELVRQTYVEVADSDFVVDGHEMTVSRVAVLTGLSRKEVVRLREVLAENRPSLKQAPNRAQRVVHGWLGDHEFLDRKKNPRVLPLKGAKGSFVALVKRYSGDITYGAVLEELNRIGVTIQPDVDNVVLINKAYVPHEDDLEQVRILAMCVSDLFSTAVRNIDLEIKDKHFQRQVTYNLFDEKTASEFRLYSSEKASVLMEDLNKFLSKKRAKQGGKPKGASARIGMGIYYLEEMQAPEVKKASKKKTAS